MSLSVRTPCHYQYVRRVANITYAVRVALSTYAVSLTVRTPVADNTIRRTPVSTSVLWSCGLIIDIMTHKRGFPYDNTYTSYVSCQRVTSCERKLLSKRFACVHSAGPTRTRTVKSTFRLHIKVVVFTIQCPNCVVTCEAPSSAGVRLLSLSVVAKHALANLG